MGVSGRLARRELGREGFPRGDGLVDLFLGDKALADPKQNLSNAGIQGVLADKVVPGGASFGMPPAALMVGGDQELGVKNGSLCVRALGAVGKLGEVTLPGRDGRGEVFLSLQDFADMK